MAKPKKRKETKLQKVPQYTGSLDAKVPSENIIYVDRIAETGTWYAVSEASDGAMFGAHGKMEAGTRRAAGLRTFAHLKDRADGKVPGITGFEVADARAELGRILSALSVAVGGYNGTFPETRPREVVLYQLQVARETVESNADKGVVVRYTGPLLCFLAGGFADGLMGKLGEKGLELLEKLLAG